MLRHPQGNKYGREITLSKDGLISRPFFYINFDMTKEELWKYVRHELEWFKHYGYWEDKKVMDMDKSLYDQVSSIGYAKVNTPLDLRCVGYLCFEWKEGMGVNNLIPLMERRNTGESKLSPMEVWLKLYPEDKQKFYNKLNKIENE